MRVAAPLALLLGALTTLIFSAEQSAPTPRGVHVLVEKPLAFDIEDARATAALAAEHQVLVLTNFETSRDPSVREAAQRIATYGYGPLRRMVFRHGHAGPVEIGCGPVFVEGSTDPERNGGGTRVDFECYGALLAT